MSFVQPATCGACGEDLNKVWHTESCPTREEGWNARSDPLFKAQNGAASMIRAAKACLLLPEAAPVKAELERLLDWATRVEHEASEGLHRLYPFSKR
jgi:hypothetical protein